MANLKDFIKATIDNNGATYNLNTGELNPTSGYFVGLKGNEKIIGLDNYTKDVQTYVLANSTKLSDKDNYLGSWINEDEIVLDIAVRVDSLDKAIKLGKENEQSAIYDASNKVVIWL
jgi:hypothetical protein